MPRDAHPGAPLDPPMVVCFYVEPFTLHLNKGQVLTPIVLHCSCSGPGPIPCPGTGHSRCDYSTSRTELVES